MQANEMMDILSRNYRPHTQSELALEFTEIIGSHIRGRWAFKPDELIIHVFGNHHKARQTMGARTAKIVEDLLGPVALDRITIEFFDEHALEEPTLCLRTKEYATPFKAKFLVPELFDRLEATYTKRG